MATKKGNTSAKKAGSATAKQKPAGPVRYWEDGFDDLADAENLFQAIDELVLGMYCHVDHTCTPTLMALEAIAEKGLQCLTEARSTFEALKGKGVTA